MGDWTRWTAETVMTPRQAYEMLADLPEHTKLVLAELANEGPPAEVLAMDDYDPDAPELPHACSDFEVRHG